LDQQKKTAESWRVSGGLSLDQMKIEPAQPKNEHKKPKRSKTSKKEKK